MYKNKRLNFYIKFLVLVMVLVWWIWYLPIILNISLEDREKKIKRVYYF